MTPSSSTKAKTSPLPVSNRDSLPETRPSLIDRIRRILGQIWDILGQMFSIRKIFGHCRYRKVIIGIISAIIIVAVLLLSDPRFNSTREVLRGAIGSWGSIPGLRPHDPIQHTVPQYEIPTAVEEYEDPEAPSDQDRNQDNQDIKPWVPPGEIAIPPVVEVSLVDSPLQDQGEVSSGPKWKQYKYLDGFYNGLRSLVPISQYIPEDLKHSKDPSPIPHHSELPKPLPYQAHPEYDVDEYRRSHIPVEPCYLDAAKTVGIPDLYAYNGLPQYQPKASLGSYDLFGIRDDVCFDRFGRYGAYGLGYRTEQGGTGEGLDTENEGSDIVWDATGKIDYRNVDWADAQERCVASNEDRFYSGNKAVDADLSGNHPKKMNRMAVVVRTFTGFDWTNHVVMNFRAMISELNLRSGGEYDVHFLLHVHDINAPIWADPLTAQRILDANVPREFHGICTLWSETQMQLFYPGNFGDAFENPSMSGIYGVYRSAHMPLQHFSIMHPEYAHIWNWELDMRYTGSYYELFDKMGKWADNQSRKGIWERSSRYYIPEYHGSWDNFTEMVEKETAKSGKKPIMGPVVFAGKSNLISDTSLPSSCDYNTDSSLCGVGEEADLVTLNPLFDAENSGWVFAGDITGYDRQYDKPPRRSAIVTASRLSRRLLSVLHEETWRLHHSMFTEMFPAAMAFHHGLKAVYAPHPVFLDRDWPAKEIDSAFNGGEDHTTGGHGSPFDIENEHNHKGTSWYYNSEFASLLWKRWLGYAHWDGRGDKGKVRGGREEEKGSSSSGRLCLRPMLFHPIKHESPSEDGY